MVMPLYPFAPQASSVLILAGFRCLASFPLLLMSPPAIQTMTGKGNPLSSVQSSTSNLEEPQITILLLDKAVRGGEGVEETHLLSVDHNVL